jgi:hypothetical protein
MNISEASSYYIAVLKQETGTHINQSMLTMSRETLTRSLSRTQDACK